MRAAGFAGGIGRNGYSLCTWSHINFSQVRLAAGLSSANILQTQFHFARRVVLRGLVEVCKEFCRVTLRAGHLEGICVDLKR